MNRAIRDAMVKLIHYDDHYQFRTNLADFIFRLGAIVHWTVALSLLTYYFARRLKTLNGLTPCEYICKFWTSEPDRFILNPIHQIPGSDTLCVSGLLYYPHRGSRPGAAMGGIQR